MSRIPWSDPITLPSTSQVIRCRSSDWSTPGVIWWPGADQSAKPIDDAELPEQSEGENRPKPIRVNRTTDTRIFRTSGGSPLAIFFSKLPGRPLPYLQYNAYRYRASSRKIHALVLLRRVIALGGSATSRACSVY